MDYQIFREDLGDWKAGEILPFEDARRVLETERHHRGYTRVGRRKLILPLNKAEAITRKKHILAKDFYQAYVTSADQKATHAAALHLGNRRFLILGTKRVEADPQNSDYWAYDQFRAGFIRHGFPVATTKLVTFRIENTKQAKLLAQHIGKSVTGKLRDSMIPELTQRTQDVPKELDADQLWLVHYECRPNVIRISASGDGFFAPGQDMIWHFSAVEEWVKQIDPFGK